MTWLLTQLNVSVATLSATLKFLVIYRFVTIKKVMVTITRSNQFAKFRELQNLFGHMNGGTS